MMKKTLSQAGSIKGQPESCIFQLISTFIILLISFPPSSQAMEPVSMHHFTRKIRSVKDQPAEPPVRIGQENNHENSQIVLFNGKDLSGWCYHNKISEDIILEPFIEKTVSSDGRFISKDNMLTINPWDEAKGPHWVNLWSTMEFTGDFILSIEFRASNNADSGIFLRGKQLQCRDYLVAGPYRELKKYRPGDWNRIEVVVRNNIARCTCNGEILEEALQIPPKGSIGLEADRGRMDYQNILLRLL